jgi:asparagine synthase (glutamine-hydrolysing)
MCGIAGYIGPEKIAVRKVEATLDLMRQRGPDNRSHRMLTTSNGINVTFLHSRLSILDLDDRSNQPFECDGCILIFNGEIYNYLEIKAELEKKGRTFRTTSDTEVLIQAYLEYGEDCVSHFEGMWAFAIWDSRRQVLRLSRDRFAEKPLYYMRHQEGFYFGSETRFLKSLSGFNPPVNRRQIVRYLAQGYKSLYKKEETFFEGVEQLSCAEIASVDTHLSFKKRKYWKPVVTPRPEMTIDDAVSESRRLLLQSMKLRLRSDVPLAFCLSGGVDSSSLVSIAAKEFNCRPITFSIIDSDERYNEEDNIRATVDDTGCEAHLLLIPQQEALPRLRELIRYHDAPVATITYYVHSMLSEQISKAGYRVAFSGTSADELFTGYYDHFLLHLQELKGSEEYREALSGWEKHIRGFVRNPILRNPQLYSESPLYREHVYDNSVEFSTFLKKDQTEPYMEENYCDSLLRNRMLNELFHESTPVILHEDDLNSMCYSVENRSPFLDRNLFEFAFSIPSRHLIRDGYGKFILREAVRGILNEKVRLDRRKKGFNASINSIINLKSAENRAYLLDQSSELFDIVDRSKIEPLFDLSEAPNHYSKFLFNVINARIFLEQQS